VKAKIRRLTFASLFPSHLMIIYIIFAHASLNVMVLHVEKICVLDLPLPETVIEVCEVSIFQTCTALVFQKLTPAPDVTPD